MERITFKGNFCDISMCRENPCPYNGMCSQRQTWERLKEYEETGLEPEEIADAVAAAKLMARSKIVSCFGVDADHVRELVQAEQDGRLVVLPCKVGDRVWVNGRKAIVEEFFGYETERYLHAQFYDDMRYIDIPFCEIGKTVFLTREEAEAALKGGEG